MTRDHCKTFVFSASTVIPAKAGIQLGGATGIRRGLDLIPFLNARITF